MTPPLLHPGLRQRLAALRRRAVHDPHNPDVREVVRLRANDACEYCLLPTISTFEVEHVIPPRLWDDYLAGRLPGVRPRRRRQGPDHLDNFAWSCPFCNRAKGGRVAHGTMRFFDPRHDRWPRHFMFPPALGYIVIAGATPVGRATAGPDGLNFNAGGLEGPMVTRHLAILAGAYPPAWARVAYNL
jgi:hypothetical protein